MGNIVTTFKRFLSNKNTVTILGVLAGIIVLYLGYNYRVNNAIDTQAVPYAKDNIPATTKITQDKISTTEVLRSMIKTNSIIANSNEVVGTNNNAKCAAIGSSIPKGSFFYSGQVVDCNSIQKNVLQNMPDGYKIVSLKVDLLSTYGNSMFPGDYIDLYVKSKDSENRLIYGEFITKLPILDVRDSASNSLFYSNVSSGQPAILLFAVPNFDKDEKDLNLYLLLSKAIMLGNGVVELVPVPGNRNYTTTVGETKVTSQQIKDLIIDKTSTIGNDQVKDTSY